MQTFITKWVVLITVWIPTLLQKGVGFLLQYGYLLCYKMGLFYYKMGTSYKMGS